MLLKVIPSDALLQALGFPRQQQKQRQKQTLLNSPFSGKPNNGVSVQLYFHVLECPQQAGESGIPRWRCRRWLELVSSMDCKSRCNSTKVPSWFTEFTGAECVQNTAEIDMEVGFLGCEKKVPGYRYGSSPQHQRNGALEKSEVLGDIPHPKWVLLNTYRNKNRVWGRLSFGKALIVWKCC